MPALKTIPNVKVWGGIERAKVGELYRNAACLCSTSDFEGFPNTFLEAWSLGIPLVTTFDPDGLVASKNLGRTAADVDTLAGGLREMLGSADAWLKASRNARSYYENNHTVEAVLPRLEAVFFRFANPNTRCGGKVLHA
ncbi:MAG: glycosyltransferase [Phycisphaerae bacterium]